ncbi:ubiquinol cytochrome c reductase subunit QCR9 [Ectocarpus siliculosus]|uniref:Ubiquinol cytochrome c reductase subunit QCR9 n=1 Tax=Ectocarpus siliculosus TaxID=2880 RepID=D7FTT2_ECTSI|nr:ubiquinol cytochrome c reductase subunit QCR9 [Ectocarpus siliculosus]|eukprot:CBJ31459.1 ubiquinol cytochrome c reductase subunit QCR9 [Ectocarpus siliculosus]
MSSVMAASRRAAVTAAGLRRAPAAAAAAAAATRGGVMTAGATRGMVSNPALTAAYNTVWKSNPMYITYIIGASVVLEFVYGKVGDSIFNSINKGKQYDDIDWSKFAEEEDEDEEEEEDDE